MYICIVHYHGGMWCASAGSIALHRCCYQRSRIGCTIGACVVKRQNIMFRSSITASASIAGMYDIGVLIISDTSCHNNDRTHCTHTDHVRRRASNREIRCAFTMLHNMPPQILSLWCVLTSFVHTMHTNTTLRDFLLFHIRTQHKHTPFEDRWDHPNRTLAAFDPI